jgi:hypothetical protein
MACGGQRNVRSDFWLHRQGAAFALACIFAGCGSGNSPSDAGNNSPSAEVSISVAAPNNQEQPVQVPQGSGPINGTISMPPVSTASGSSGDLTLQLLSGANVAFESSGPTSQPGASIWQRDSDMALPGGPYIFEMKVTAPFTFTLASVPGLMLNLGLAASNPNASYTIAVLLGAAPEVDFTLTAVNGTLSFPGASGALTVPAGSQLTVGIILTSNVSTPDAGSPDAGSADAGSADAGSLDAGLGLDAG